MSWCSKVARSRMKGLGRFLSSRCFSTENLSDVPEDVQQIIVPTTRVPARVKIDPNTTTILLFSGQGSQKVGMAKGLLEYPNVKQMFSVASDILNYDLLKFCQNGPQSELDRTVHCQPAILVTSLAAIEKLQVEEPNVLETCSSCSGYSVGEYAALVFSGAMSFEDAVRLVKTRAEAMQSACNETPSGMITAVGRSGTQFKSACNEAALHARDELLIDEPVCKISAYLAPNLVTIAGHKGALEYLVANCAEHGVVKTFPIPVSGAFHCELMRPAVEKLSRALRRVTFQTPIINVYSNLSGRKYASVAEICRSLPLQLVSPVRWEQTLHKMFARDQDIAMPHAYEAGPGKQLGALLKKCNGKAYKQYLAVNPLDSK